MCLKKQGNRKEHIDVFLKSLGCRLSDAFAKRNNTQALIATLWELKIGHMWLKKGMVGFSINMFGVIETFLHF